MEMRRKEREVTDINEIEDIIKQGKICHVAMLDGDMPYVVPLSYGYKIIDGKILELYFHSSKNGGRKIDILQKNSSVCFAISNGGEPVNAQTPCNSGYYFSSVIGNGEVVFIADTNEKKEGLALMFKQQANQELTFNENQANAVCVYKIVSNDYCGKKKLNPNL